MKLFYLRIKYEDNVLSKPPFFTGEDYLDSKLHVSYILTICGKCLIMMSNERS